jgi:hypothetical protein
MTKLPDGKRLQVGFASPDWQPAWDWTENSPPRRPIGFVHFGPPEPDPPPTGWLLAREHRAECARWAEAMEGEDEATPDEGEDEQLVLPF